MFEGKKTWSLNVKSGLEVGGETVVKKKNPTINLKSSPQANKGFYSFHSTSENLSFNFDPHVIISSEH
jgi:hypothetical protein